MNQRLKLSRGGAIAAIVGGDLLLLLCGWFMLVGPQRSTAQSIARSAEATEVQVQQAKAPAVTTPTVQPKQPEIRTAYLYKLSKAMPMTQDMPNLLLELNQVVRDSGVQLSSISPGAPDPTGTSSITLSVSGDFYSLTDLLYRLRTLVSVHSGSLDVAGRLFAVKSVGLTPDGPGRGLAANIQLDAFTFGSAATPTDGSVPTTPATTTSATTTSSTTTTTSSASADSAIGP